MKIIHSILETYKPQYEDIILSYFIQWTEIYTITDRQAQLAIIDKPIRNWFLYEWAKLEFEFLELIENYPKATKEDKRLLYTKVMVVIYGIYPSGLLEEIKKNNRVQIYNLN